MIEGIDHCAGKTQKNISKARKTAASQSIMSRRIAQLVSIDRID
jgi:hypothetical protein